MSVTIKGIAVIVASIAILAIMYVIFGRTFIFIEEGVLNFWAMVGGMGAFICSFLLLVIKIAEELQRITGENTQTRNKGRGYR